jgi:hypothetical protein
MGVFFTATRMSFGSKVSIGTAGKSGARLVECCQSVNNHDAETTARRFSFRRRDDLARGGKAQDFPIENNRILGSNSSYASASALETTSPNDISCECLTHGMFRDRLWLRG